MPQVDVPAKRQPSQGKRHQCHPGLGEEEDAPPVENIRHRPANQGEDDDRQDARQPNCTKSNRLVRNGADVPE